MRTSISVFIMVMILIFSTPSLAQSKNPDAYLGGTTTDISAAANAISESSTENEYLLFNETIAEFSLLYPKGALVAASGDMNMTDTAFLTPYNMTILKVTTIPKNLSLDELISREDEKISELPDFTMISTKNRTVDTIPVKEIEFKWRDKTGSLSRTTQIFASYEGRVYVITVQLPDTTYEQLSPVINKMIGSFRFIPVSHKPRSWYLGRYGWIWYPDAADLARYNWDLYSGNNYFSSTDYWGTGMDWLDVSNARWDWYMNSGD